MLGYPSSYERGGYTAEQFRELGVPLPPTVDEDLRAKPTVHSLMKLGQTAYIGALRDDAGAPLDYVNFYAYLHRVVDEKIGRAAGGARRPGDPGSLRSRTVIARTSDHGELGLSHGGLRQKMFNGYEESIRVPLVISNPVMFPQPRESDALASLVDLVPTLLGLTGEAGDAARSTASTWARSWPARRTGRSATPCCSPTTTTRPGRRSRTCPASPTGSAACATRAGSTRSTSIRSGRAAPEYELYDLESDPDEAANLVDKRTGRALSEEAERERVRLHERLERACADSGTLEPAAAAGLAAWRPPPARRPRSARRGCCGRGPRARRSRCRGRRPCRR